MKMQVIIPYYTISTLLWGFHLLPIGGTPERSGQTDRSKPFAPRSSGSGAPFRWGRPARGFGGDAMCGNVAR